MRLKMLIKDMKIKNIVGNADIDVSGVAYDSRKVRQGDLFVAIKGEEFDGHDFVSDAIKRGAPAVVCEKRSAFSRHMRLVRTQADSPRRAEESVQRSANDFKLNLSFIEVENSRDALAYISNNFYERPSDKLTVIGITGTNGKTTTTYIIKSILEAWGKEVGLIGTISYIVKDSVYSAPHTTPEALEFQSMLKEMLTSGCSHVVTEVSSHALSQKRVDYTRFDSAVFTNLTQDHLDFHHTMEDYFKAKERLFKELLPEDRTAVINLDDIWGLRLIHTMNRKTLSYGVSPGADLAAANIKDSFEGLTFDIKFKGKAFSVASSLVGMHNVYNILSAAGAAVALNVPWDVITEGIRQTPFVKGRFEKVDLGQDFLCIVDYAHTEDALERLINTARELIRKGSKGQRVKVKDTEKAGKIITVFGCGGNRDRGKRPKMGAVATRLSDYVVITSDNPRNEDPHEIIKEIEAGVSERNYIVEPDRGKAIKKAVGIAKSGDILLVAGKGHEDYQEIKGKRHRFSDREIIEEALRERLNKNYV